MALDTPQSKPIAFEGPVQGPTIGDNNKVDNYFDNRTMIIHVDGKERTVPYLVPCLPSDHSIVGHEQLLSELKAALFTGKSQSLVVLPGVGKTTLAIEAANDKEVLEHFPDGVLWASLGHHPDILGELKRWAWALDVDNEKLAQAQCVKQVSDIVASAIGRRRMLLVVDDVWQYDAAKAFKDLGSHCGHLIISRIPEIAIQFTAGKPTKVRELTSEEGVSLLSQFIPEVVKAEPQAALELAEATGGLPLALTLLGSRLKLASYAGDSERIRDALKALHIEKKRQEAYETPEGIDNPPTALAAAIELSFSHESLGDEERRALQALSIMRPKPHALSKDLVLEVAGVDKQMLYKLDDVGLIECIPENRYTMQRTIAEYIRGKLSAEELKARYQRAVDYFRKQMMAIEESLKTDGDYAGWYRYESKEWQAAKNNWLYYLSHTGDESATALAFLRAYFDAFWWWGCYLDFAYCDQLIKEWQQRESSERDRDILTLVRKFQNAYPKETEDRHATTWPEAEAALVQLLQLAGLDGDPSQWPNEERRHVRGLTNIFRAEVYRFGRNELDMAAKWYQEASDLFEKNGDHWDMAWVLYHFAEMNFERGKADTALDQLHQSLTLGISERDPEVIAHAHRVRGDIFLSLKDIERAADSYRRAAFHAYRFQAEPSPPDPYTVQFYSQMVEHILEKLKHLYVTQQSDAIALSVGMHHFWTPAWQLLEVPVTAPDLSRLWDEGNMAALKTCMFPPELLKEDIGTQGAQYEKQVKAVCSVQMASVDAELGSASPRD
ncbi:MAG: NB-ARC domain-containing protein [Methylophilaceae bacterium]